MPLKVYRLTVTPPAEAADPEWKPQAWVDYWEGLLDDYVPPDDYKSGPFVPPFTIPARRHYFSRAAAERKAEIMRGWGCTVAVDASKPVEWE
jgi:hypothetical protein